MSRLKCFPKLLFLKKLSYFFGKALLFYVVRVFAKLGVVTKRVLCLGGEVSRSFHNYCEIKVSVSIGVVNNNPLALETELCSRLSTFGNGVFDRACEGGNFYFAAKRKLCERYGNLAEKILSLTLKDFVG